MTTSRTALPHRRTCPWSSVPPGRPTWDLATCTTKYGFGTELHCVSSLLKQEPLQIRRCMRLTAGFRKTYYTQSQQCDDMGGCLKAMSESMRHLSVACVVRASASECGLHCGPSKRSSGQYLSCMWTVSFPPDALRSVIFATFHAPVSVCFHFAHLGWTPTAADTRLPRTVLRCTLVHTDSYVCPPCLAMQGGR